MAGPGRRVNFSLTQLNAIASRDGDAKDIDSARTALEVVALRHVVGGLHDYLAFYSMDFREIDELEEKWSG
ncbi:hypothetical protein EMIT0P253_250077 [Pseudomonas sp. IT-P253]